MQNPWLQPIRSPKKVQAWQLMWLNQTLYNTTEPRNRKEKLDWNTCLGSLCGFTIKKISWDSTILDIFINLTPWSWFFMHSQSVDITNQWAPANLSLLTKLAPNQKANETEACFISLWTPHPPPPLNNYNLNMQCRKMENHRSSKATKSI